MSKKEKIVAIMLDLQGTLDGLEEENAKIFMHQVECLVDLFKADKAILVLSSHVYTPKPFYKSIDLLEKVHSSKVQLGICNYLNGDYNPETREVRMIEPMYNVNKFQVFSNVYLTNKDVEEKNIVFFAVVDDEADITIAKTYQNQLPLFISRPSQINAQKLLEDNFMCYSTYTKGFDGVIETLKKYLENINGLSEEEIFWYQKREDFSLSYFETEQTYKRNIN